MSLNFRNTNCLILLSSFVLHPLSFIISNCRASSLPSIASLLACLLAILAALISRDRMTRELRFATCTASYACFIASPLRRLLPHRSVSCTTVHQCRHVRDVLTHGSCSLIWQPLGGYNILSKPLARAILFCILHSSLTSLLVL